MAHPLDPLTGSEIEVVANAIRNSCANNIGRRHRFVSITLAEPSRTALDSGSVQRVADVIVLNNETGVCWEISVAVPDRVVRTVARPGVQPPLMPSEYEDVEKCVRESPLVQEAMKKRGVMDMSQLQVDLWAPGYGYRGEEHDDASGLRLGKPLLFLLDPDTPSRASGYARPIQGVQPVIDLNAMRVIRVDDFEHVPIPKDNTHDMTPFPSNSNLRPIVITQPEGATFTVDGWLVKWLGWDLRVGFNAREGLTLHQIGYTSHTDRRPVLHRASMAEMVVPYGDPRMPHYRKNALDVGEEGIGFNVNSLTLGCDCLGEVHYFDVNLSDSKGRSIQIERAICLHEEDIGVAHKHTDWRNHQSDTRRGRRLVVSNFVTVANYDYGFFWYSNIMHLFLEAAIKYFYMDGSIEFEAKMTGMINVVAHPHPTNRFGQKLPSAGLYAPIHQHFFSIRLDVSVDGHLNTVSEVNLRRVHSLQENAFEAVETELTDELTARRDMEFNTGRYWKIYSKSRKNIVGDRTSYKLVPGHNSPHYFGPGSPILKRASFIKHHFWVTPDTPWQRYPAGQYPNQSSGGSDGLEAWTREGRSLQGTPIVVWYTMGATHVVRLEDWPIMPVALCSFAFRPCGFFDYSPTVQDVPAAEQKCEKNSECRAKL